MPTEIKPDTSMLMLVNVFETTPETQQPLIDASTVATEEEMSKQPGFVSAKLHASRDGLRVANHVQWESAAAFETIRANPTCRVHMEKAERIAKPDIHLYDVASTSFPSGSVTA
jgi:heme-degrading monooxygenase HmoA